ncbi:hypothetical protein SNE40_008867 [Patella caerulea]|uniref:DNA 3'-5' helicase n=1 Tax=Patella caerulea TaxID=87958 RepID=A0AAN8JMS0_PATCE
MKELCDKLVASGFNAAIIGRGDRENITFDMIENGNHDFVFVSPENAVGNMKWRDVFACQKFLSRLKLIVVDAHTILQWGENHHGEEAFRIQFKNIGELRSICLDVPMMALTATASPLKRKQIMKKLNFKVSPAIITDSADRTNIKISSKSISTAANISDIFNFAIHGLYTLQQNYPRTIIFCCSISDCAKIYSAFLSKFGMTATIFNMYHSKTKETVKTYIRDDMNDLKGTIRILICTNAAGMGINFKGVENVLHFGLPRDMDTIA